MIKKLLAKLNNGNSVVLFPEADTAGIKDLYKKPNTQNAVPFGLDHELGEDQWYYVVPVGDLKIKMIESYAIHEESIAALNAVTADHASEMKVLYLVSGEEIFFTKVTSRLVSKSARYISIGSEPSLIQQDNAILLTGQVDAYWSGVHLYFKKFSQVQSLFPGMGTFYKEITEKEANTFLSSSLFELREEMSSEILGNRSRKLITSLVRGKGVDLQDAETCEKYLEYAKEYNLDLEIENDKIALIDNSDIGKVISLLSENYYTTSITDEKREMRTSRKIDTTRRKRAR